MDIIREKDQLTLSQSAFEIIYPKHMTPDDLADVEEFWRLFVRKAKRAVVEPLAACSAEAVPECIAD